MDEERHGTRRWSGRRRSRLVDAVAGAPGRPTGRRVATVAAAMALAVAGLIATGPIADGQATPAGAGAGGCTADGTGGCLVTIPCATAPCPSVDVTPNTGLANNQYVYVTTKNFVSGTAGNSMRIALCAPSTSATNPQCLNGPWEASATAYTPITVPINQSVSGDVTSASVPVFLDPSGVGNQKLPSHNIEGIGGLGPGGLGPGFYCDDTTDPCALYVTLEDGVGNGVGNGPAVSPTNTAIIPLDFASQENGCPSGDPSVTSESSFSMEHFLPAAVDSTCTGAAGVLDLNTATDTQTAAQDFSSSNATLSFIDNPGDASEVASLQGKGFAYIPVAASASAVAMLAGEADTKGTDFPIPTYNLTPTMVAGLITSSYQNPLGQVTFNTPPEIVDNDNLVQALTNAGIPCTALVDCYNVHRTKRLTLSLAYNAFDLLNPVASDVNGVNNFGAFMSDVASGANSEVTSWICSGVDAPYQVTVHETSSPNPVTATVTDTNTASSELTQAPVDSTIWPPANDHTAPWVFPTCTTYSTFPALAAQGNQYDESETPELQAKAMRAYAFGGGSLPVFPPNQQLAAFGIMDSSEASFYGLDTASLENADGNFVQPTPATIDAALADATPCPTGDLACPAGTYRIDFTGKPSAPDAYPLPDLTYAVVPTAPQPPATAAALKDLLTNLVTYSAATSGQSVSLPAGYAPLPKAIEQAALTDISNDVTASSSPATTTTTTSTTAPTTTTSVAVTGSTGSGSSGSTEGTTVLPNTAGTGTSTTTTTPVVVEQSAPLPTGVSFVRLDLSSRLLLPFLIALAIGTLLIGPLLLVAPLLRRRRTATGGDR